MKAFRSVAPVMLAGLFILSGCGSDAQERAVLQSLNQTRLAIDVARSSDAKGYAAAELAIATEKLQAADAASQREEYAEAERLLAEAMVNIELAQAKASAARAKERLPEERNNGGPSGGSGDVSPPAAATAPEEGKQP